MGSERKLGRRERELLFEFDLNLKDIRQQLNEQLKCLDVRTDTQVLLVAEIQDFFRRRAEVELEYSKNLEKLARGLVIRHKAEKQKREQWHMFSSYSCWQHLINSTRRQSKDHAILSDIYSNNMINRLTQVQDNVQRIYKKCRDIGNESHEEILKGLHELHTAMKTYHTYYNEFKLAESKLNYAEQQRAKLEQTIAKEKLEKSKKFRLIVKEIKKRQSKYNDAKLKGLKARNEYLLCIDTANSSIHKYFVDDLSDLIDCMDFGFHNCIARAFMTCISAEESLKKSKQSSIDTMNKCISGLDSRVDKQKFLEFNNQPFMIPKKFTLHSQKGDEVSEVSVSDGNKEDMNQRYSQLCGRLTSLKAESEEIWKTLETAERSLMDMVNTQDYDCTNLFSDECRIDEKVPETVILKKKADQQETEDFYLKKFREYTLSSNLIARLQAKSDLMRKAIGTDNASFNSDNKSLSLQSFDLSSSNRPIKKKRIGRTPVVGHPKLFGGSLEEYVETTNQEIPLIVRSCIRIINLFGLQHQGIFRVSGAQVEINNFKESFERVEDPLADMTDASDINSVSGVLKLYFRELREPLFPICYFEQLMEISKLESKEDFIRKVREVVSLLPRPIYIVLRYLFAFLNHLSEFSDENMMDPYNLAICFGPTLLPIPEDKDQVLYQNLVNELIKNIIIYQEEIFIADGGMIYEKYISRNTPDETDVGESPPDQMSVDVDVELCPSEDEVVQREREIGMTVFGKCEVLEAVAQYDFTARSNRELSFRKGDMITLYTQVSNDWWRGSFEGKHGLIPDKYILLKIKDEDSDKVGSDGGEIRRRKSSSSDSLGSGLSFRPESASRSILSESGISLPYCDTVDENEATLTSASSLSSDLLTKDTMDPPSPIKEDHLDEKLPESPVSDGLVACAPQEELVIREDGDNAELSIVLDSALAAVYDSISTLERQKVGDKRIKNKDTPDLVMDLPLNGSSSPLSSSSPTSTVAHEKASTSPVQTPDVEVAPKVPQNESKRSSTIFENHTAAEVFAQSDQCTLKKGSTMSRSTSHVTRSPTSPVGSGHRPGDPKAVKRSVSSSIDLDSTSSFIRDKNISSSLSKTKNNDETLNSNEEIWQRRIDQPVIVERGAEKMLSATLPIEKSKKVEINLGLRKVDNVGTELSTSVSSSLTNCPSSPDVSISSFKPKPKLPPPVMKKPSFKPGHTPSPELMRKFAEREYRQTSC